MPHAADPLHGIRPTGGTTGRHSCVDLRRAKGPLASSWSTFAYSNSVSISSSPIGRSRRGLRPGHPSAALEARLPRSQKLSPPVRRPRRRDPHRPRHGLEIFPAQQTHHHLTLAPGREPTPTAAPGGRFGRPPGSRRRRRTLIWLPHLDTPPASTLSQSSVQENPGAQDQLTPARSRQLWLKHASKETSRPVAPRPRERSTVFARMPRRRCRDSACGRVSSTKPTDYRCPRKRESRGFRNVGTTPNRRGTPSAGIWSGSTKSLAAAQRTSRVSAARETSRRSQNWSGRVATATEDGHS